jgi:hypothetical protein
MAMKNVPKKALGVRKIRLQGVQAPVWRVRDAGSTILAVLVALVFIGIVVASMLRNTGSQSGASVGYGAVQSAAVTAASGIVATVSFFENSGEAALDTLNAILDAKAKSPPEDRRPFIFGNGKSRLEIAGRQFFSSRLVGHRVENKKMDAHFEVSSGTSAGGRSLKTARAFYHVGNIVVDSDARYNAKNTFYSNAAMRDGNNGMHVKGEATFEKYVKFQNTGVLFEGSAFFGDTADFGSGVNHKIKGNAYFHSQAIIQTPSSANTIFENDVGFNGNVSVGGTYTINMDGNVYVNGDFRSPYNMETGLKMASTAGEPKNFYYADKLSACTHNGSTFMLPCYSSNNQKCELHNANYWERVNLNTNITNFENRTYMPDGMTGEYILGQLGMESIENRRDPQISMENIPAGIMRNANDATSGNNLDVGKLTKMYEDASGKGELYNGHLVVKVSSSIACNGSTQSATFNDKVIFIVENGAVFNVNSNFYNSGDNASTLIYAGPGNAALQQFGTNGLFRGLVYIDSLNTAAQNSFQWGGGGRIEGAVHNFSDGNFNWNLGSGSLNNPPVIAYNEDVLNGFASLVRGSTASKESTDFIDKSDKRIYLQAAGFYFH